MASGDLIDAPASPRDTPPAGPTERRGPAPRRRSRPAGRGRRWVRRVVGAVALVLVPLVLVAAVYVFLFAGDSPSRLTLSPPGSRSGGAGSGAPAGVGDVAGTWTVGAGSVAGYRVKEKLASLPVDSEAVGRTGDVVGSVVVRADGDGLVADAVTVQVNVSTLVSDEKARDNRIRTTGLESNLFPTASFVGSAPAVLPAAVARGEAGRVEMAGLLTLHGVARQVTVALDVRLDGSTGEVVGSLAFPFSDYDMSPPSIGGFVAVGTDATLEFRLLLERSS